jgi:Cof subfamily protein (haloacid dehalogenase superfamily)
MPPYRFIFSDIDGTLLNSDRKLSQTTIDVCSRLYREKNIRFALASGRGLAGIKPIAETLGVPVFMLPCNGAEIYDENQKLVRQTTMDYSDAVRIKKAVQEFNPAIETIVYAGQDWIADEMNDVVKIECTVMPTKPLLGDFETIVSKATPVLKVISIGTPENTTALEKHLKSLFPRYDFYKSQNYILETTAKDANKASGMAFLCDYCNIDISQTIAFGDGHNDVTMLRSAGLGIAMGNADDDIKAHAKRTTLSNNENGVAHALTEIFY